MTSWGRVQLIGIAVAAIATLTATPSAFATYPGAEGRLAFALSVNPSLSHQAPSHVFTAERDGSNPSRITEGPGNLPSWSRDGKRLVFVREGDGTADIATMNADGSQVRVVKAFEGPAATQNENWYPEFAPSGRRILYTTPHAIRTIRSNGTRDRSIRTVGVRGLLEDATYSPDGKRIAFAGVPRRGAYWGIWTMRRDGSGLRRLTTDAESYDSSPDFSPDGRHIVFEGATSTLVMRADGSRVRTLFHFLGDPTWSPTGRRIVGSMTDPECSDLFATPAAGIHLTRLTDYCARGGGQFAGGASWQPLPRR